MRWLVPSTFSLVCAMADAVGRPHFLTDWQQRNISFFTALQVERNVMFIILSLIILVAALNIISGMMMLVKDKGRDIAVLRTMGASKGSVMRVFLITGASIGVVGTIAGLILGIVFCWNIEAIHRLEQVGRSTLFTSWMQVIQITSHGRDCPRTLFSN